MITYYAIRYRAKAPAASNQSFRYGWRVFNAVGDFVGFVPRYDNDSELRTALLAEAAEVYSDATVYELTEVTVGLRELQRMAHQPFPWQEPPRGLIRRAGDRVEWLTVVGEPYRAGTSGAGNPRYGVRTIKRVRGDVVTTHYRTMYDAAVNYGIRNGWRDKTIRRAVASISPGGTIRDLKYLDDE